MAIWRALAAALLAVLLSRIDDRIERSALRETPGGRAWRMYRDRMRKKPTKANVSPAPDRVVDTEGGPAR